MWEKRTSPLRASSLFPSLALSSFRTAAAFAYSSSVLLPRFSSAIAVSIPASAYLASLPLKRNFSMRVLSGSRLLVLPPILHLQASVPTNLMVTQRAD